MIERLLTLSPRGRAAVFASAYVCVGVVWIVLGGIVVTGDAASLADASRRELFKGIFFIGLTGGCLFALLAWTFGALDDASRRRDARLRDLQAVLMGLPHLCFRLAADGTILEHLPTQGPAPAMPPEAFLGRTVAEILPPPAGETLDAAVRRAQATGVAETISYAMTIDASERHYSAQLRPLLGGELLAMIVDETEAHLAAARQVLASQVFEHAPCAIVVTDAESVILSVNPAFEVITGYRASEVIGRNARILRSGRHDAAFYARIWAALAETGRWEGEIWNRRRNGQIFPEQLEIQAVPASTGQRARYIGVFQDLSEAKRAASEIDRLNHEDPLTRLPNRNVALTVLESVIAARARDRGVGAILSIDLAQFSKLNTAHGFDIGDVVLRETAVRIVAATAPEDLVARVGADEFLVVREHVRDRDEAARLASDLAAAIGADINLDDLRIQIAIKTGIALIDADSGSAWELIRNAETARRAAGHQQPYAASFYRSELTEATRLGLSLDSELAEDIAAGRLVLHYQGIHDRDGARTGAEALVRWRRRDGSMVPPNDFIGRAEQSGQIAALGAWVLRRACRDAVALRAQGHRIETIAVNVSPVQFATVDLVDLVQTTLNETGLPAATLELELTESALMQDIAAAAAQLQRLADLGIRVAVDDFGTGYSSLATLRRFAVRKLKIDRAFVDGLPDNPHNLAICRAVIELSRAFHLTVHAEGVETQAQLETLNALGCDCYQGFHFSKPLPLDAFVAARSRL